MAATVGILAGGRTTEKASTQKTAAHLRRSLQENGYSSDILLIDTIPEELGRGLLKRLHDVEVVLPLISGLEGFLAALDVAYVGSTPLAAALGAHKGLFNDLLDRKGLKLVAYWHGPAAAAEAAVRGGPLSLPVFVKPCRLGASNGISRVENWPQLPAAIAAAAAHDDHVLVEEAVRAPVREFGLCGVIASGDVMLSDPCEVILPAAAPWHDNESKYSGRTDFEPVQDAALKKVLQGLAAETIGLAEFRGAVRVDLFVDGHGSAGVGEINCVPGYGPYADTPRIFEESGVSRGQLFTLLIASAKAAQRERAAIRYSI